MPVWFGLGRKDSLLGEDIVDFHWDVNRCFLAERTFGLSCSLYLIRWSRCSECSVLTWINVQCVFLVSLLKPNWKPIFHASLPVITYLPSIPHCVLLTAYIFLFVAVLYLIVYCLLCGVTLCIVSLLAPTWFLFCEALHKPCFGQVKSRSQTSSFCMLKCPWAR